MSTLVYFSILSLKLAHMSPRYLTPVDINRLRGISISPSLKQTLNMVDVAASDAPQYTPGDILKDDMEKTLDPNDIVNYDGRCILPFSYYRD